MWYTDYNEWISTTGMRKDSYALDFEKGTYYLKVNGYRNSSYYASTGNYNFTVKFTASDANVAEPNNNVAQAKTISFNSNVKGQIAINDREDYYKLNVTTSMRIDIKFYSYMQYYCLYLYNEDGVQIWYTDYNEWISTTGKRQDTHPIDLNKGTYYLKVNGYRYSSYYASTGNYSFKIIPVINVSKVSNLKASQTTSTITLKWSKVSGVKGYQIYKYDSSKKKYVKVATTTKTSYKFSKLKSATTYKFKVRAYKNAYQKDYFSAFTAVTATTKPTTPTLKVTSTSKGKATLKWSNVSGETGYQVYYSTKKSSDFKKLSSFKADTTKATASKLKSGKTYYFKVRAYKKVGNSYVYGAWSSVSSVKIK